MFLKLNLEKKKSIGKRGLTIYAEITPQFSVSKDETTFLFIYCIMNVY